MQDETRAVTGIIPSLFQRLGDESTDIEVRQIVISHMTAQTDTGPCGSGILGIRDPPDTFACPDSTPVDEREELKRSVRRKLVGPTGFEQNGKAIVPFDDAGVVAATKLGTAQIKAIVGREGSIGELRFRRCEHAETMRQILVTGDIDAEFPEFGGC